MVDALVAAGHDLTADAAVNALEAGGNAFDAVVGAGFAAAVAEPTLTSLAGGGFLLSRTHGGDERLFDFFVDTPGTGRADTVPHFVPVTISFPASTQDFNAGWGSIAVPGILDGYLHVHRELGRLDLDVLVAPAVDAARAGVVLNERQASLIALLEPILTLTDSSASVFAPGGRLLGVGENLLNEELAEFIAAVGAGSISGFADPKVREPLVAASDRHDGLLTRADLDSYSVIEREPLAVDFRGRRVLTNPAPCFGGPLLALALEMLDDDLLSDATSGIDAPEFARRQLRAMRGVEDARLAGDVERRLKFARGTTHISISDHEGNVASMTTSNGEGAGCLAPGTGVMLNNMLGEEDLHPDGFHSAPPGERVASMMSPSVVVGTDGPELVLGSGGSKRIRTAMLQVLASVVGSEPPTSLAAVVDAPRFHWDGACIQAEPGLAADVVEALAVEGRLNQWDDLDLYFGGVHAVRPGRDAAGDPRRGGTVRRFVPSR